MASTEPRLDSEGGGGEAGSQELAAIISWLPPLDDVDALSMPAERLPMQFQNADSPEQAVKQYLAQEAVPVLTQALMDLCMEEPPPAAGETIPWMIRWLQKLQESKQKEKEGR